MIKVLKYGKLKVNLDKTVTLKDFVINYDGNDEGNSDLANLCFDIVTNHPEYLEL